MPLVLGIFIIITLLSVAIATVITTVSIVAVTVVVEKKQEQRGAG